MVGSTSNVEPATATVRPSSKSVILHISLTLLACKQESDKHYPDVQLEKLPKCLEHTLLAV